MMHVFRPVLEVLMQRGIQDPCTFLRPSQWADLPDPSTVEGVVKAVPFLLRAVKDGLRITIFGDYDCDGALSSAILEATLLRLGAAVDVYLPHRDEGYGLGDSAVHRFSRCGTKVLITIDNGINAAGPVHLAQRLGMSVVTLTIIRSRPGLTRRLCGRTSSAQLVWPTWSAPHSYSNPIFLGSFKRPSSQVSADWLRSHRLPTAYLLLAQRGS